MHSAIRQPRGLDVPVDYIDALEAGADDKFELFERWIARDATGTIVDIGSGPGAVAARLAAVRPACRVLGVDAHPGMVAQAIERRRGGHNLTFRLARADAPLGVDSVACILSSVLHEVAAQGGLAAVDRSLRCAASSLVRGGRLILRDFVRPADPARPVRLLHARHDLCRGRSFSDFAAGARFAVRFDGYRIESKALSYDTDREGAYEFALRKDCGDAWGGELGQRYAFWSEGDCRQLVQGAGLRILHLVVGDDRWVMEHRLQGRLGLRDAVDGQPLTISAGKVFLVAERP